MMSAPAGVPGMGTDAINVLSQLRLVSPDLGTMVGIIAPGHMGARPRSVSKAMELGRALYAGCPASYQPYADSVSPARRGSLSPSEGMDAPYISLLRPAQCHTHFGVGQRTAYHSTG